MPDAIITSTESTFGTISGTFAADQSTISGTILGPVAGSLSGSVGVPGPAGVGVPAGGLEGQIIVKASETDYDTVWADNAAETLTATVRNETGATLTKGTVVYINGAAGNKATVTKASAATESGSSKTFAILKDDILDNQNGTAVTVGLLKGVDTSAFSPGANLWLSTTAGQITQTMPTSPNHAVFLGNAVRIHANQGEIEVRIQNGLELGELHDVLIHDVANGQVLKYDSAQGLWVNGTDSAGVAWGGITGTLSDQTDLQTALDGKYSTSNPAGYITSSALTGYATESFVTSQGYITSAALSPYLLSSTAASTYQTIAGMSSYLTTSAAASTYYPLTNPSGYITSSALAGYATESWVTGQLGSYLTTSTAASTYSPIASPTFTGLSTFNNPGNYAITIDNTAGYYTSISSGVYSLFNASTEVIRLSASGIKYPDGVTQSVAYPGPSGFLLKADNLSGLASASTARTNLGLGTMATESASTYAPLASPALTGNPTAPTPATADNDTSIATTAFVKAQGYLTTAPVTSVAGKTGAVTLVVGDVSGAAPLASPTFTGTPAAPTATAGTNTTQIATTAFVTAGLNLKANLASPTFTGTPAAPTASAGTSTTQLATTAFVTTADNLKANLASPTFTGTPAAPTASPGTNTTQIATTAFVTAAVPGFATLMESRQFTNTTKAMSPRNVFWAIQSQDSIIIRRPSFTYTTTGTIQYNQVGEVSQAIRLSTSAASSCFGRPFGVSQVDQTGALLFRENFSGNYLFSRPLFLSGRSGMFGITDSTLTLAFYFGKAEGDAIGDLTRRGYGWKVTGGAGSRFVSLEMHNGTTLTSVTSSFAVTDNVCFDWDIYADGTGNVTLYINGSQVATVSGGPTNYNGYTPAWWREEFSSSATPTSAFPTAYFSRGKLTQLNFV